MWDLTLKSNTNLDINIVDLNQSAMVSSLLLDFMHLGNLPPLWIVDTNLELWG